MKIRSGFVSNSSSSSFVICGFKLPDGKSTDMYKMISKKTDEEIIDDMKKLVYYKDKELKDFDFEDYCWECLYEGDFLGMDTDIEMGEGVNGVIIGKNIADFDDDYVSTNIIDLNALKERVENIRKDLGFEDVPIKIYTGTKSC